MKAISPTQKSSPPESSGLKNKENLDSVEVSEAATASACPRCKHYKALEDAIESIETPLPLMKEFKWLLYGLSWIALGTLFFTLLFRDQLCAALDRLEKELS